MELLTLTLCYTGILVVGFVSTHIYDWYTTRPVEYEDALLIDVACQTSPIKKIPIRPWFRKSTQLTIRPIKPIKPSVINPNVVKMDIDDYNLDSDSESFSSLENYFITNS